MADGTELYLEHIVPCGLWRWRVGWEKKGIVTCSAEEGKAGQDGTTQDLSTGRCDYLHFFHVII